MDTFDDNKRLNMLNTALSADKSPRTTPIDIEALKDVDENKREIAKNQANIDINQYYDGNVVNDTINSDRKYEDAFKSPPKPEPVDTLIKAYQDGKTAISGVIDKERLDSAIKEANLTFSELPNEPGSGRLKDDISLFMKRIAIAESNYGQRELGDYSFSPFQIDPIRYVDIQQKAQSEGLPRKRANIATNYLKSTYPQEYGEDFNILDLDLNKLNHDPRIGAFLTRLTLGNIQKEVPLNEDIEGQGQYWVDYWNQNPAEDAKTSQFFIDEVKYAERK